MDKAYFFPSPVHITRNEARERNMLCYPIYNTLSWKAKQEVSTDNLNKTKAKKNNE